MTPFQDTAPKRLIAFPFRPMNLGITRSGSRVHRLSDADPLYSPCGKYLNRRFVKTPLEVSGPLCELCFETDERGQVNLAWMEQS